MNPRHWALALTFALIAHPAVAVVEAGHWSLFHPSNTSTWADINLEVRVEQTQDGDYTGTLFAHDAVNQTLRFVTLNLDEGSTVILTTPGEVITRDTFSSTRSPQTFQEAVRVGQEFYLGVGTVSNTDPGYSMANPGALQYQSFGWAHVRADASGKLSIIDSAMAFREPGIVVGTLDVPAVPEPSTWALMGLGLLGIGWAQQRTSKR